jgi:Phage integrase family
MTPRQYARLASDWFIGIGLDPHLYGTHSLRRTKATLIYRRTGNLKAVQLLLGHTKIESTVRYLGIDVDDALVIAKRVDIYGGSRKALPFKLGVASSVPQMRIVAGLSAHQFCNDDRSAARLG